MILPLFSAIEKAITVMAKATMSPIDPYGIPMILSLRLKILFGQTHQVPFQEFIDSSEELNKKQDYESFRRHSCKLLIPEYLNASQKAGSWYHLLRLIPATIIKMKTVLVL